MIGDSLQHYPSPTKVTNIILPSDDVLGRGSHPKLASSNLCFGRVFGRIFGRIFKSIESPPRRPTHRVELAEQSEDPLHAAEARPLARRAGVVAGVDPGLGRRVEAGQAAALLQHALVRSLEQTVRHLQWSQFAYPGTEIPIQEKLTSYL